MRVSWCWFFPKARVRTAPACCGSMASLFEPAVRVGAPVTAAAIGYSAGAGAAERDLCYYGDISFAPHLIEKLQLPDIVATMRFASPGQVYDDRKLAASLTREAVIGLRSAENAEVASANWGGEWGQ